MKPLRLLCLVLCLAACAPARPAGDPAAGLPGQSVVDTAADAVRRIRAETYGHSLDVFFNESRGVLIVPVAVRAGFIGGVDAGEGVLLLRDKAGFWSEPSFVTMSGLSFGLQIGLRKTSAIFFLLSDEAVEAAKSGGLSLGTGMTLTALTWGEVQGGDFLTPLSDICLFVDADGLYAGVALSGGAFVEHTSLNRARYGADATPKAILEEHRYFSVPGHERLHWMLSRFWNNPM